MKESVDKNPVKPVPDAKSYNKRNLPGGLCASGLCMFGISVFLSDMVYASCPRSVLSFSSLCPLARRAAGVNACRSKMLKSRTCTAQKHINTPSRFRIMLFQYIFDALFQNYSNSHREYWLPAMHTKLKGALMPYMPLCLYALCGGNDQ